MNLPYRSTGTRTHPRWQARANQARRCAWLGFLLLAGCSTEPGRDLAKFWDRAWGPASEGRPPPPGADGAYPNLGTVPPRPAAPDAATREALTETLATQRQASREPLSRPGSVAAPRGAPPPAAISPARTPSPMGGANTAQPAPTNAPPALPEPAGIPALPDLAPIPAPNPSGAPPPPAVLREAPRRL